MGVAVEKYDHWEDLINKHGLSGRTLKMMLVDSGYTFASAHTQIADINANEITDTDYTAGGATVTGAAFAAGTIDVDDVVWSAVTFAGVRRAILYISGTLDSKVDPPLLSFLLDDTPADVSSTNSDFSLVMPTGGLVI